MLRSLMSGVAGLKAYQTKMDVIGNNIANVNTVGFKSSNVNFSDIFYQKTQSASAATDNKAGVNPKQIGYGSSVASIATTVATQGGSQTTNRALDLMINGNAFFIVEVDGQSYFTKNGAFDIDGAGNLANESGGLVMGWGVDPVTGDIIKDSVDSIKLYTPENQTAEPDATSEVYFQGNIDNTDGSLQVGKIIQMDFLDNLGNQYAAKFKITSNGAKDNNEYSVVLTDIIDSNEKSIFVEAQTNAGITTYKAKQGVSIDFAGYTYKLDTIDKVTGEITLKSFEIGADGIERATMGEATEPEEIVYNPTYDYETGKWSNALYKLDGVEFVVIPKDEINQYVEIDTDGILSVNNSSREQVGDMAYYYDEENKKMVPITSPLSIDGGKAVSTTITFDDVRQSSNKIPSYYDEVKKQFVTFPDKMYRQWISDDTFSWSDFYLQDTSGKLQVNNIDGFLTKTEGNKEVVLIKTVQFPLQDKTETTTPEGTDPDAAGGANPADPDPDAAGGANPADPDPDAGVGTVDTDGTGTDGTGTDGTQTGGTQTGKSLECMYGADGYLYAKNEDGDICYVTKEGDLVKDPSLGAKHNEELYLHPNGKDDLFIHSSGYVVDKDGYIVDKDGKKLSREITKIGTDGKPIKVKNENNEETDEDEKVTCYVKPDGYLYTEKGELINENGNTTTDKTLAVTATEQLLQTGQTDNFDKATFKIPLTDPSGNPLKTEDGKQRYVSEIYYYNNGSAYRIVEDENDTTKWETGFTYEGLKEASGDVIINGTGREIVQKEFNKGAEILFNASTGKFASVTGQSSRYNENNSLITDNVTFKVHTSDSRLDTSAKDLFDEITVDFASLTMFADGGTSTVSGIRGNKETGLGAGWASGVLAGVSVGPDGRIYGDYDNGVKKLLGQIAVTTFANPTGLEAIGNSLFKTTENSGEFDGIGKDIYELGLSITSGALESSNVDLSQEFTNMITTQRGFEANSKIITTSDTMLETLINLKR